MYGVDDDLLPWGFQPTDGGGARGAKDASEDVTVQ